MSILPPPLPPLTPATGGRTVGAATRRTTADTTPGASPAQPFSGKYLPGALPLEERVLSLNGVDRNNDPKEIKKAAQMMEGFFLSMLLKEMDKTIPRTGLMDGGTAEEFFREMLYDKMGEDMARAGGIGLGDMITRQLTGTGPRQAAAIYGAQVPFGKADD